MVLITRPGPRGGNFWSVNGAARSRWAAIATRSSPGPTRFGPVTGRSSFAVTWSAPSNWNQNRQWPITGRSAQLLSGNGDPYWVLRPNQPGLPPCQPGSSYPTAQRQPFILFSMVLVKTHLVFHRLVLVRRRRVSYRIRRSRVMDETR